MLLRPATAGDADAVAGVLQRSRAAAMPWLPVVHGPDDVRDWVGRVLLPGADVEVAEEAGEVVGVCATREGRVEQLYVLPDAQGRGVGRALLDAAKARSGGHLQLWTFARNARARRFDAAAGFAEVRETDGAGNEEQEPDVLLAWRAEGA